MRIPMKVWYPVIFKSNLTQLRSLGNNGNCAPGPTIQSGPKSRPSAYWIINKSY